MLNSSVRWAHFLMAGLAVAACGGDPAGGQPSTTGAAASGGGTTAGSGGNGTAASGAGTSVGTGGDGEGGGGGPVVPSGPSNIDGVTGVVSSGQSVTVTGTGFGVKSPAAPILWETFDDGVNDAPLSTDSDWPTYAGNGARYSDVSPHSGGLCVYNWVSNAAPSGNGFATNNFHFPESDEIYYSYLYRHEGTSVGPAVQKSGRINTTGNLYSGPGVVALSDSYVYYTPGDSAVYPADDDGTGRYFSSSILGSDTWTRHQLFGRLSTPAGQANGLILVSVGDEEKTFADIVTREAGNSFQFESVILGLMFANINTVPGAWHDMYLDDVYIDNTRARVELCTGMTWELRGECQPQPATSWDEVSITITINGGQWASGQTVFVYVLDADGVANDNGFGLVFDP